MLNSCRIWSPTQLNTPHWFVQGAMRSLRRGQLLVITWCTSNARRGRRHGRQEGKHLHLTPQALHQRLLPPYRGATEARQAPAGAARSRRACVRFNLTPTPTEAADPGTVFLARLPGFCTPRGSIFKPLPATQPRGGCPPGSGTTPSSPIAATKKLGGALWASPARAVYAPPRITCTQRDNQQLPCTL